MSEVFQREYKPRSQFSILTVKIHTYWPSSECDGSLFVLCHSVRKIHEEIRFRVVKLTLIRYSLKRDFTDLSKKAVVFVPLVWVSTVHPSVGIL